MTRSRPILLMTRPRAASERFVAGLDPDALAGVEVLHAPLMEIAMRPDPVDLGAVRGLIFTSANGVAAAAARCTRRDIPAFCVGPGTTRAARQAGWPAQQAGIDADSLVAELQRRRPDAPLLHIRGSHARGDIAARMSRAGIPTHAQVLYDQRACEIPAGALARISQAGDVIAPLFSPRSARLFRAAMPARPYLVAALSPAVAQQAAAPPGWSVHVCDAPDGAAMTRLVEKLLRDRSRVEGARLAD